MTKDIQKRANRIKELLEEKKGENVQIFDLIGRDYFVDMVVIATSLGDRHTLALLDYLKEKLKPEGEEFLKVQSSEDWVVIDLGDIIVHIMSEAYRDRYNIEEFLEEIKENKQNLE